MIVILLGRSRLQLELIVAHTLAVVLLVARGTVSGLVLRAYSCLVVQVVNVRLIPIEVELAIEVCHGDTGDEPTTVSSIPRTARLLLLVVALAQASLVNRQIRLLVDLAHLTLRQVDFLVLGYGVLVATFVVLARELYLYGTIGGELLL